jgi:hypothetical protein
MTVSAGLFLKPIARSPYGDDRGPDLYLRGGRPSGFLGVLVGDSGPVWGWLDVTDSGVRWRPRRREARWGYIEFDIAWRQVTGADLTLMYAARGGAETILMVQTVDARLEFLIPHHEEGRLKNVLADYLTDPGPPVTDGGPPQPAV